MKNRPALISVTCGRPAASSLTSMLNAPDAAGAMARTARRHTSTTAGVTTVFASEDREVTPLGMFSTPKYDNRSKVLASTSRPRSHTDWQRISRPGRYSDRVNERTGRPCIVCQRRIQARAWSGLATAEPPRAQVPVRGRHQRGRRPRRAKTASMAASVVTRCVAGAGMPRRRSARVSRYLSRHSATTARSGRNKARPRRRRPSESACTCASLVGTTRST